MNLVYLPEHAENAMLALELAEKEVAHMLIDVVAKIKQQADTLGINK